MKGELLGFHCGQQVHVSSRHLLKACVEHSSKLSSPGTRSWGSYPPTPSRWWLKVTASGNLILQHLQLSMPLQLEKALRPGDTGTWQEASQECWDGLLKLL